MKTLDLFRYASGALTGHGLRTGLSLTGVAIGVASVILLTSLGEGARQFVVGEFASLGTNLVIVVPGRTETSGVAPFVSEGSNDLTLEDSETLERRIPQVRAAAPMSIGAAVVRHGERSREVSVVGTTASFLDVRKLRLSSGQFLPGGEAGEGARTCAIGAGLQRELYDGANPLGSTLRVGEYRFRVTGVLANTGTSIGFDVDDMVYVPVTMGMKIFNQTSLFRILLEVGASRDVERVQRVAEQILTERHGENDVTVITQDSVLSTFSRILAMLTLALAGIAAVSLGVAGIGIMNVMLVSVVERTREIGLLKALGGTRRQITGVFLVEAAILSSFGGALGMFMGLGIGRLLSRAVPNLTLQPPAWAVIAAVVMSVLVGIVFGAWPARRAARQDPVAALAKR